MPIVAKALPYLNAILMVLVEIGKIIAEIMQKIFGFDPKVDLNFGAGVASEIEDIVDEIDGIGDSSSGAAKNVKNLKNELLGLRSFDQLINLTTPTSSSKDKTGSGSSSGLGVSDDILNLANKAMDEYNKKIENVRMKATEIRDRIMEWLGFTKKIDEKTGEVSFKFDHITSGTVLGALAVGGSIFIGITKILNLMEKVGFISSSTPQWLKVLSKLGTGATKWLLGEGSLVSILDKLPLLAFIIGEIEVLAKDKELHQLFKDIIDAFKDLYEALKPLLDQTLFDPLKQTLETIKELLSGMWDTFVDLLANLNEVSFSNLLTTLKVITDILKGDLSQAILDVEEGLNRLGEFNTKLIEKLSDSKDFWNDFTSDAEGAVENFNNSLISSTDEAEVLKNKLLELVDSNGKVKDSDKALAETLLKDLNKQLGTQYKLTGNVITENGKELESVDKLSDSLETLIKKKKLEILLDAYREEYVENLKKQQEQQQKVNELEEEYYVAQQDTSEMGKIIADETKRRLEEEREELAKTKGKVQDYDDLIRASYSNNAQELDDALKKYGIDTTNAIDESYKKTKTSAEGLKKDMSTMFSRMEYSLFIKADTTEAEKTLNNMTKKGFFEKMLKIADVFKASALSNVGSTFASIFKADGGVYAGGQWHNIQRYDGGGMPQTGQLFWARENGLPEMVGQIGGHTAVMNNDQIVGSVANGVYKATREALASTSQSKTPQIYNFYLDKNHKLATYTLEELQSMARNNGKAITIA